ncbi:hypothetical protein I6E68_09495 [Salinibacterium sp. NSLL150]|uniref:thioredoxin family protein n=1 Tax=unclassified Salinibacterium TaxID=2632331 RepID=UPI0018CEE854|nr:MULTISPECIES: thioredoxin domain-containing protein [unclassified Salinibacterium]MBH0099373.1 hypothetical protein [Salinibacterium sp. NSLL35]MBH0102127.1 hypothetical protein [Salinibacterium sp. NSLL150]MBH0104887.1 hypothetical protein [Salinibacterium sp. NSLL16]MBH0107647.1 hypothetical protein [Salinibacterium sp. NSLL17]
MNTFLLWFGLIANIITVLAGVIAFAGVVWAVWGRARLTVRSDVSDDSVAPSLFVTITSVGSNPLRHIEVIAGSLDDNGFSTKGGDLTTRAALDRGQNLTVEAYEPEEVSFGDPPRDGELRFTIRPGQGIYLTIQWQSPLFPWRRLSRTYSWPPVRRYSNDLPEKLTGRREIKFLKRTRNQSLNPASSAFAPPAESRTRATVATDDNFNHLVSSHSGPVLVGFGPTWQGKLWEDAKRTLDAFASAHSPRVMVLVVDVDNCPELAERFETDPIPVFKVLAKGAVVKSYVGMHSVPDLRREFAEYL